MHNRKIARNDSCPCGSGKKYKKCCILRKNGVTRKAPLRQDEADIPSLRCVIVSGYQKMGRYLKRGNENGAEEKLPSLNTRIFWLIAILFIAVDIIGIKIEGISVVPGPVWNMTWRITALVILSLFYTYLRPDVRIATLMHTVAMFAATSTPIAIFYYLAISWHQPLADAYFAAADRVLGLNWTAAYQWITAHPQQKMLLSMAYYSLLPQTVILIFVLNFLGESRRCWEMPWLLLVSSIITIPFSIFFPATGPFGYFHVNESMPAIPVIASLHNGTLKTLDFRTMEGVVTFPSYHAASAIMIAYAARGTGFAFLFFVLLNALMFIATPVIGGHYFVDIWGGIALALATILIVRKYCSTLLAPRFFAAP